MKIYTKTGDKGTTGLLTGERVKKTHARVEAYGCVDEINSALGLARACATKEDVRGSILKLQKMLTFVMAELASSHDNGKKRYITQEHTAELEGMIDRFDQKLPPLKGFILPGESMGSASLDLARTLTRRAERQVLRLFEGEGGVGGDDNNVLIVLNRLSDLCFVLSRFEDEYESQ